MTFMESFSHDNYSPYMWGLLLLISLRGMYTSFKEKDWIHFACFGVAFCVSVFFTLLCLDIIHPF
ncbi:MAG: hypothetical protein Q4D21_10710 [Phascolarctobacterium sp.]|nr:hypothetical protein [Phascolarctobacterium sp.]